MIEPKYKIGQVVKVFEYYADMIVKDVYYGLVVDIDSITGLHYHGLKPEEGPLYIYHVLPNDRTRVETAEEFAIEEIGA